ncbi:MAG: SulP family inorganic anion transporter [Bdellovibrionia bacterium]
MHSIQKFRTFRHRFQAGDFWASIVVFLVALPLCMGIAIASGVPPTAGLMTGIIGGLIVGLLSGSPLLVSGPAAGLAVLVWEIVQDSGLKALGMIVLLAGIFQLGAAVLRLGQWFRAVSPAVIHGMLAGIGVLIFASQFHVMLDDTPRGSGIANLISIPDSIFGGILDFSNGFLQHHFAAWVGTLTILTLILWNRYKPKKLTSIPAPLVGVFAGTLLASVLGFDINRIQIPNQFFSEFQWTTADVFRELWSWKILGEALAMAFIASAETLLSAAAVDQMHLGCQTKYDKELGAQGIGNILCGALGALPMTGVIVRSTANVQAGAKTRASTILHGLWILLFVSAFPSALRLIPTSALAAILVYTGYKLVDFAVIRRLGEYGKTEVLVYLVTLVMIVVTDLLTGVITGLVLALLKTLVALSRLSIKTEQEPAIGRVRLILSGALTFYQVPKLASILQKLPENTSLELDVGQVTYIDHACLELLASWEKRGGELHIRGRQMNGGLILKKTA